MNSDYYSNQVDLHHDYESTKPKYSDGQRRALDFFFSIESRSTLIMDCACGDGVGLAWFKDNGFTNVFGVELNPKKAAKAVEINHDVLIADMHDLNEVESNAVGAIWTSHSVEHAHSPLIVLKEFNRVLVKGGRLCFLVPFPDTGPMTAHCGQIDLCTNQGNPDDVIAKIESCGFKVINWKLDNFREPEIWIDAIKDDLNE